MLANIIWHSAHIIYYTYRYIRTLFMVSFYLSITVFSIMGFACVFGFYPVKHNYSEKIPFGTVQLYHGDPYIKVKGGWQRVRYD